MSKYVDHYSHQHPSTSLCNYLATSTSLIHQSHHPYIIQQHHSHTSLTHTNIITPSSNYHHTQISQHNTNMSDHHPPISHPSITPHHTLTSSYTPHHSHSHTNMCQIGQIGAYSTLFGPPDLSRSR